jgi:hypothetical protein
MDEKNENKENAKEEYFKLTKKIGIIVLILIFAIILMPLSIPFLIESTSPTTGITIFMVLFFGVIIIASSITTYHNYKTIEYASKIYGWLKRKSTLIIIGLIVLVSIISYLIKTII